MSSSRDQRRELYERMVGQPVAGNRFVITKLLGFGGMGAVYEARQQNMNRSVALKLIPTHDPTTVARFEREAMTISQLRHPNTITVFDYGTSDGGFLFLAMELLEGRTLSDVIREDGPLPPERAVHIASQICRSLNEAHQSGIVHRDIKPDNIILIPVDNDPDVVKVLDFGIAKAVMGEDDVQLTGDGRIIGTPRYMSPEQILAEPLDHRSDIYSLGCILFEMLCGAPPFQQSSTTALMISHTQDPPPPFAQRLPPGAMSGMPGGLEHVVRKSLEKNPQYRFMDTMEMYESLQAAITSAPMPAGMMDPDSTAAATPVSLAGSTGSREVPVAAAPPAESQAPSKAPLIGAILVLFLVILGIASYGLFFKDNGEAQVEPEVAANTNQAKVEEPKPREIVVVKEKSDPEPAKPGFVQVEFKTTPAGAAIYRNGEDTGKKTPTLLALRDGEPIDFSFKLDGYEPYQAQVIPAADKKLDVALVKKKGSSKPVAKRPSTKKPKKEETKPAETEPVKVNVDLLGDEEPDVERLD